MTTTERLPLSRTLPAAIVVALLFVATPLFATDLTPGEVARALAGREVPALAADATKGPLLAKHGAAMSRYWGRWEKKLGDPLATWAREAIPAAPGGTLFYPFSGPDFATAHRIWPDAERYVFVAYQKAGRVPRLGRQDPGDYAETLSLFRKGLASFASLGFFVTTEMNERFGRTGDAVEVGVEGITGILLVFAELEGFDVQSVEPIRVARDGAELELHPGDREKRSTWNSVRLELRRRADGRAVTLEYVRIDLLDDKLEASPHNERWLERVAQHPTFLKAASHLLQRPGFSFVRELVLARAPSVLQDESGLPFDRLDRAFDVRLYGHFDRFHERFQEKASAAAIRAAYKDRARVSPLPFRMGYDKRAASCLQYGWRRAPAGGTEHP